MTFFISHSEKDKEKIDKIIDLFQLGMNISFNDIFCSSAGSIPIGNEFIDKIKRNLKSSKVFICYITPNFLESKFCLCELGSAWISDKYIIPIIEPPISFSDIASLPIRNFQAFKSDSQEGFMDLYDTLVKYKLIDNVPINRYITKVRDFLADTEYNFEENRLYYNDIISGKLGHQSVSIGTTKQELLTRVGHPEYIGTVGGSTYYAYDSTAYYFELELNDNSRIFSIGSNGGNLTKKQVLKMFGKPIVDSWSDLDSEWYIQYEIAEYTLYFGFVTDESNTHHLDKDLEDYYMQYLLATKNSYKVSHIMLSLKNET